MNIFAIVVTYKGHHWYKRCFDSLRCSDVPIKIIVIDNASNDGTIEYIKANYPEIILLESKINLGFGQGNNVGIKYAVQNDADYVLLLNQDAWIEPDSISELIKVHKNAPEYGVLGPMLVNSSKKSISAKFENYFNGIIDKSYIDDFYFNRIKNVYTIETLPAAVWLIPYNVLKVVGGFDPIFFHYGEDDHYVQRVKYHGFKIGFCPNVRVVHDSENIMLEGKIKYIESSEIKRRVLLLEWLDINRDFNHLHKALNYTKLASKLLLTFRLKRLFTTVNDFIYLLKVKDSVYKSRDVCINNETAWLKN